MANIVPANISIPAHLAGKIGKPSALAASVSGGLGGGADYPRISIKGARFRIVEGSAETVLDSLSLDIIIVGANPRLSKVWYAKAWTPDSDAGAPDCYSLNGVAPASDSAQPQNDLCATCEQNAWGSKVTPQGQPIKACADQKRLAVVAADDPEGPVYLLQVTPTALKGLNSYQKELTMRGIALEIVKTRVSFDSDASFPKLKFGFAGFIDEAAQEVVEPLFGNDKVREITGEADAGPAAASAIAAPAKPKLVAAAEPAEEEKPKRGFGAKAAAAEPAAEEKPKRGFGAKAAAPAAEKKAPKKAAPVAVAEDNDDLADEIAKLVSEVADDAGGEDDA